MIDLPKPSPDELDNIVDAMRMDALEMGYVPKKIREAKTSDEAIGLWRAEALRFWYCVVLPRRYGERIERYANRYRDPDNIDLDNPVIRDRLLSTAELLPPPDDADGQSNP